MMVPSERSKSEVTEPGRAAKLYFHLNKTFDNLPEKNEITFLQPFTAFVSLDNLRKNSKKSFLIITNFE